MRPAGGISSWFRRTGDDPSPPAVQPHPPPQTARASSPLAQRPGASPTTSQPPRNASLPRSDPPTDDLLLNQQRCADLDHSQWYPLPPALREFATGRMRKALAQEKHFGAEHLQRQGGICSGVMNVWLRLHHAHPDAQSPARLATLMSEPGTTQALTTHRLYLAEVDWHTRDPVAAARLGPEGLADTLVLFEASQHDAKAEIGLALQPRLDRSDRRTYGEIAAAILRREGYAECVVQLQTKDTGRPGGHSICSFNPGGDRPVTICDCNLGEFLVAPAHLQEFLRAWAAAYGRSPPPVGTEPCTVRDIAVYPVLVSGDIATTRLASLGEDLRAAGRASGHAALDGASPSQPGAARGPGLGAA